MRKLFIFLAAVLLTASVFAQSPEKMSYQAVIRDASDNLVTSQQIGMQISILQGSASGTAVYVETQESTTNANGLVSLEIGTGTVQSGDFSTIDWENGPYFIKTETAVEAPLTNYTITGTSQLLSVPYALHAKSAESITGTITETDPTYSSSQAANITATDIANLGNLSGVNTGDQDLSTLASKTALGDSTAQVRSEIPDVSGFLTSETDPTYTSSQAANITATDITNLSNLSGTNTGDQDLSSLATKTALGDSTAQIRSEIPDVSGFLTSETDPTYTSSQAANITATDITNLGNLSGTNTGDQDLSSLATKTALGDSTAQVRSEIPDVSGFLTSETDPTYTSSEAANITATDITNLGNLSGTNTGDQDLSSLATKIALGDSTAQIRSEIPDVSGFLTSETDPTYTSSQAANITATDITNLSNLSGTNTGDQDLSSLATKTALGDSTAQVRSEIPDVPTGTQIGQMQYWNGTAWVTIAATQNEGASLQMIGGVPTWTGGTPPTPNVTNPTTGEIWMDRNLGASQVATSSTDADSYGDLYQWGRAADGHESRTSGTTTTLATSDTPGHGDFITNGSSPYDWRNPQNDNLWQGVSGTNNPCPSGYRVPTEAEWEAERTSWSSNNSAGAFASPLKLPVAGSRYRSSGSLGNVGSNGRYWSSTVDGPTSRYLYFGSSGAGMSSNYRAYGYSVRCLKD